MSEHHPAADLPGREEPTPDEIRRAVARLNARILGTALGLISGFGLFLATAVLLLKGGPRTGAHLWLLSNYFPGYSVTWPGAFVGFAYAFFLGFLAGHLIGLLYNRIVSLRGS
ncbi:MAG: hypothetical protein ABR599_03125 [Gemmatimonadota bacterium]